MCDARVMCVVDAAAINIGVGSGSKTGAGVGGAEETVPGVLALRLNANLDLGAVAARRASSLPSNARSPYSSLI